MSKLESDSEYDYLAVQQMELDNAKNELDEISVNITHKLSELITSIGLPIGDKLTSFDMLNFNIDMLNKYEPKL